MKYYDKIDGLRFIAIFFVLIEHFMFILGKHISAGYFGVDLFFVISGFLITLILLKPNGKGFRKNYLNFLGRRTLRIFPIYYLTILILWLLNLEIIREKLIWFLTYSFNYADVIFKLPHTPVTHFWSLNVEEQFYLFWPLVVLALKKKPKVLLCVILLIIIVGYTQTVYNIFPALTPFNRVGLLTRMASLGLGALGSVLVLLNWLPDRLFKSKLFEVLVFLVLILSLTLPYRLKLPVLGLCSFYLVVKAAQYNFSLIPVEKFLKNKYVIRIGMLAYGIYIFHLPLAYYFTMYIFDPIWASINFNSLGKFHVLQWNSWIIKFPLYTSLSILIAFFSYKFIELPILKMKDRYFRY